MLSKILSVVLLVVFIFDGVFTSDLPISPCQSIFSPEYICEGYAFSSEFILELEFLHDPCVGERHSTEFVGSTCCKNETVIPGIGTWAQWEKCAVPSTDDNETYADTIWRIYTCILKMVVPKNQDTISLIEFGKAMTAKYPEAIKTEINEKLKGSTSDDATSSGVDFKNIEMINQLRANYFDVEKQICGGSIWIPDGQNMTGIGCTFWEEYFHRGGSCCKNKSLPIGQIKYNQLTPRNCSYTLSKFKDNLEAINSTHVKQIYMCEASCHLIQKGVISVEDLISFKVTDDIPTEKILKEFMPNYFSKMIQKNTHNCAKTNFSAEAAVTNWNPEMHGCAVHSDLRYFALSQYKCECS